MTVLLEYWLTALLEYLYLVRTHTSNYKATSKATVERKAIGRHSGALYYYYYYLLQVIYKAKQPVTPDQQV